jgi:hypothetical protein
VATSNTVSVTVHNAPSVSISPTSTSLDLGQSQTFSSSVSGGTSPFTYQWYLNGTAVSGATSASWTFTPTYAGYYTIYLKVIDSVGVTSISNTASATVHAAPSVSISPSSTTIDMSQSKIFNSTVSGGWSPYTYKWYVNGVLQSSTTSTFTFTPSASGSYSIYLNVTDNLGVRAKSNVATVTVNPYPSVAITPTTVKLDTNQHQTFQSTTSGGTSPWTYQWYKNGTAITGATASTYNFSSSTLGVFQIYVNATDSLGLRVESNSAIVTVHSGMGASVAPNPAYIDIGQSLTFSVTVTGGTSPYNYQWYLNGSAVSGAASSSWTWTPSSSIGYYMVSVNVTDSAGNSVLAGTNVWVNTLPSVTISPLVVSLTVGQSQTFTSSISGGTWPYTYQWYLNGTAVPAATGSSWIFTATSSGTYYVLVSIVDDVAESAGSSSAWVTVTPQVYVAPSTATPDLSMLLQYFYAGNILGFFQAMYVLAFMGSLDLFYGMLILLFTVPLYIRTKSIVLLVILWTMIGSAVIAMAPALAGLAIFLWVMAVTGLLWRVFVRERG